MVQNAGAAIPLGEVTLDKNTYILDSLTADRFQKTGEWYSAQEWRKTGQDATSTFTTRRSAN
jgi:hypothetical protein